MRGLSLVFYLASPERGGVAATVDRLGARMGATVLGKALPAVIGLGIGAAGPVVLHVGVSFTEEPIEGATYEPTDGATVDPYPETPACASANVLGRAKTVASAIVVSFMRVSFSLSRQATTARSLLSFHQIFFRS
jgi:hypothetical protein